jgi:hypothetical protein
MSADGRRIAIGGPLNGDNNQGRVRVFELLNGDWSSIMDFAGSEANDRFGTLETTTVTVLLGLFYLFLVTGARTVNPDRWELMEFS